jgi:hypothetical protein
MLVLKIPEQEYFDEVHQEFVFCRACTLKLEHSLVSISKWESKWKKPFLTPEPKTPAEFKDYIRCMTINQDVPDEAYELMGHENVKKIEEYIMDPATATTVTDRRKNKGGKGETPTSELIYYWMISNGIPFECEKWRLNRLITLIKICNAKGNPQQMSKQEIYAMNAALNNSRRAASGSRG